MKQNAVLWKSIMIILIISAGRVVLSMNQHIAGSGVKERQSNETQLIAEALPAPFDLASAQRALATGVEEKISVIEPSIQIKNKALVIGPVIRLSEIGIIDTPDRTIREKLGAVTLGMAPPPGESKDLTLSYIKQQIRKSGLHRYLDRVSGPKTIRVTTAHKEITKAILEDAVARGEALMNAPLFMILSHLHSDDTPSFFDNVKFS
jgi:hypothetical protein